MIAPVIIPDQGLAVIPHVLPEHLPKYPTTPPIAAPITIPAIARIITIYQSFRPPVKNKLAEGVGIEPTTSNFIHPLPVLKTG